jgi:hypothetical protein
VRFRRLPQADSPIAKGRTGTKPGLGPGVLSHLRRTGFAATVSRRQGSLYLTRSPERPRSLKTCRVVSKNSNQALFVAEQCKSFRESLYDPARVGPPFRDSPCIHY